VFVANYLIGLREGLEAALVVSILVAYLVKSGRRDLLLQIWAGVAVAVVVSLGFGALLTYGPNGLTFRAQEAIGGSLSIVAVGLVTWMILWMARTARHLRSDLEDRLGEAVATGRYAVLAMALFAVGREGLETALFLWSTTQQASSTTVPLGGAGLGIATSVGLGWLIFRGAVRLNLRTFFAWTGGFLVLVAGGVLAYGIHDLQEARLLPGLHDLAFDVSAAVPPTSWYGTLLKGVLNFSPATTKLELLAWVLYVVPVMYLFVRTVRGQAPRPRSATPAAATTTGGHR